MTETRTAPEPTARRPLALPVLAAAGVLAGVAAKAADETHWGWAADLGSFPAAWVLTVALLGRFAPSWRAAALRSAVFFAAMSIAYYAWAAEVLDFGWNRQLLGEWLVMSLTAVPATALAAWWASRRAGVLPGALLNLAFSTQAAYAAPLILLAQNRQADRDRVQAEEDRARAASIRADTEYLARDFIRDQLNRLTDDDHDAEKREKKAKKKRDPVT